MAFSNDWPGEETNFPGYRTIYNTKRDFRGSYHSALQELLPIVATE